AAAFSKTEEYEAEGSVSPIDWIRHQCRMSTGAVWNSLAVGENLEDLPRSVEAVESAEIGYAHLTLMARTAQSVQGSPTAAPFEEAGYSTRPASTPSAVSGTSVITCATPPIPRNLPPSRAARPRGAR